MRLKGRTIFSLYLLLVLYLSVLICSRNYTTVFIAFLTLGWHALANYFCAAIASYRFKNPAAKYVEIKNDVIRKIFVRPFSVGGAYSTTMHDKTTNIIGLVLNIINTLLFVSFEILLFMPKMFCDLYIFSLGVPTRQHHFQQLYFELYTFNEIIPAEVSRVFVLMTALIFSVFWVLFEHQLKEHRRKIKEKNKNNSPPKALKNTEWYYPLYTSLVDISVRRNKKKHKFWYEITQLKEIEDLVSAANEHAELKLERKGDKLISFTVIDTLDDHVVFEGFFI